MILPDFRVLPTMAASRRCWVAAALLLAGQAAANTPPVTNIVLAGAYGNLVRDKLASPCKRAGCQVACRVLVHTCKAPSPRTLSS